MTTDNLPGVKIQLRELDKTLLKDVDDKIKNSGKFPYVIDTVGQAATFLKYRDSNVLNCLDQHDMEPETIRMAVIGAIRFGKPLVIDMMDADLFSLSVERFDGVQKGLMEALLDKSILKDEKYMSLVRKTDSEEYNNPYEYRVDQFLLVFITTLPSPNEALLKKTYPISIQ